MRAPHRFSLKGPRLRLIAVLVVGALCGAAVIVAVALGTSPKASVVAARKATSDAIGAQSSFVRQARLGVRYEVAERRAERFLRRAGAVSVGSSESPQKLPVKLYVRPRSRHMFRWKSAATVADVASPRSLASGSGDAKVVRRTPISAPAEDYHESTPIFSRICPESA